MLDTEIWAHWDQKAKRRQTLSSHSQNVAALCGGFCQPLGLEALGRLIGLLHDGGKGASAFQAYLRAGDPARRGEIPHAYCGARYCWEQWGTGEGALRGLTAELAAAAICAHHSGLPDVTGPEAEDGLHRRAWPEKPVNYEEALDGFFTAVSRAEPEALFGSAQREVGALLSSLRGACGRHPPDVQRKTFYFQLGLVQRFLLSCLIDADRYDTFLFEADAAPAPEPASPAFWSRLSGRLEAALSAFPAETPIDRERRHISEQCLRFSANRTGIFRLSVPTGSEKTMASLRYALNCAKAGGKKHVFYIAPYKSILEQNAEDIRRTLGIADESVILEHHGDAAADHEGADEYSEEARRYELLTQRWDAPIILTTAVQFLNTLFDGRSACVRRMHSLADSVLILDEFQAMPVRCTSMLNTALNFLASACGCAVVLCTATQPRSETLPVPLLTGTPEQMTDCRAETLAAFRRTRAVDLTQEDPLSAEDLAQLALDRLAACDNILVVVNTKAAARAVYQAAADRAENRPPGERIPVYCLTTGLCPQHRMDQIGEIRAALASPLPGANRMICVSTQLIEAGVNLSFQCVVRSLAGLDSITQSAGRCNRHGETASRDVLIVRCGAENLSSLPELQTAQEACRHTLDDFRSNPGQFGWDLLSPEAVRRYYRYFFALTRPQLAYPAARGRAPGLWKDTSLFDLLSVNSLAAQYCAETGASLPDHPLHQAYRTAGGLFEAIERGGMDVIVPYGAGADLIAALYAGPALPALAGLLRRAQRFSVHLFEGERLALEQLGAVDFLPDSGAAVLREEFYDSRLGLRLRPGELPFLNL